VMHRMKNLCALNRGQSTYANQSHFSKAFMAFLRIFSSFLRN
jgi:hypothetical protein